MRTFVLAFGLVLLAAGVGPATDPGRKVMQGDTERAIDLARLTPEAAARLAGRRCLFLVKLSPTRVVAYLNEKRTRFICYCPHDDPNLSESILICPTSSKVTKGVTLLVEGEVDVARYIGSGAPARLDVYADKVR
jgi:hypothetical protein